MLSACVISHADTPAANTAERGTLPLPMPQPVDEYLHWIYGEDWRDEMQQVAGRAIPRGYLQKGLFSPGLDPASRGVALTHALMSLASCISQRHARAAMAMCEQILAVEAISPVRLLRERLIHDGAVV